MPLYNGPVKPIHPAPFSTEILNLVQFKQLLPKGRILDPFAGIGRIHRLADDDHETVGVEIEPEWAAAHPKTIQGNALYLPFPDKHFDGAFTSPCYGNRMADSHNAKDGSTRRSYTHDLRTLTGDPTRKLHPDNAGDLYAWQKEYWAFHEQAWSELRRVLKKRAPFILNVSDCIHRGRRIPVVARHIVMIEGLGFQMVTQYPVRTQRMRKGENHEARADREYVLVFD